MRKWNREDARDAVYVIQYYFPELLVKTVSVTDTSLARVQKGQSRGKLSNVPGEYGLFINFCYERVEKPKGISSFRWRELQPKIPYYCNSWHLTLSAKECMARFIISYSIYKFTKSLIKITYPTDLNALVKNINKLTYWKNPQEIYAAI